MYKNETTSYLVKDIPVSLWKKVRAKALTEEVEAIAPVVIKLLEKWENGEIKINV